MRAIERTTQFRPVFRREMSGRHRAKMATALTDLPRALATATPLADRYRDHPLQGNWSGFRDCHVRPDLVLIYEKPDAGTLRLVGLGSHSEPGW